MPSVLRPWWARVLLGVVVFVALLALLLALFPWDSLRGPINRYVSEKTGRQFAITRRLDVKLGRTTRVIADGIEFANPDWAKDRYLVRAEGGEFQVRLWPLIAHRRIELPLVSLRRPELGLQVEPDGRRTWALGRDTKDRSNVPDIGAFVVDQGVVHFIAPAHGADVTARFAIDGPLRMHPDGRPTETLPLHFDAQGVWQKEPFTAKGRTGNILYLSAPLQKPFPMEIDAAAGATRLRASGEIASLGTLEGANAVVDLQGANLQDLYKLLGVVLPGTPRYTVHGRVTKRADRWEVQELRGKLGNSDIEGRLAYDRARQVPHLAGELRSAWLDFKDLAPIIGMKEIPHPPPARQVATAQTPQQARMNREQRRQEKKDRPPRDPHRKVLPETPIDLARLKAMNAEVSYRADRITNAPSLPLERAATRVRLEEGVLLLDPLDLGVAGGQLAGRVRIDGHANPAIVQVKLDGRSMQLGKLFPSIALTKSAFGKVYGGIDLQGRGNSVARVLGSANGSITFVMGPGQISNLLLEIAGLDGREIVDFLIGGDQDVPVRCAASDFDVQGGLMRTKALVIDTTDTIIYGNGSINLGTEEMDLYFKPYPKDKSILSLRSPLILGGTLGAPHAGPDKRALGGRAGLALALGAINPLLALAATVETGPGKNANCGDVLRSATSDEAAARVRAMQQAQERGTSAMGGPAAKPRTLPAAGASPAGGEAGTTPGTGR